MLIVLLSGGGGSHLGCSGHSTNIFSYQPCSILMGVPGPRSLNKGCKVEFLLMVLKENQEDWLFSPTLHHWLSVSFLSTRTKQIFSCLVYCFGGIVSWGVWHWERKSTQQGIVERRYKTVRVWHKGTELFPSWDCFFALSNSKASKQNVSVLWQTCSTI